MVLDFEYGINTGNRFLDLVDHDEDPDDFIAGQTQPEEKQKKSTKDTKSTSSTAAKKKTTTTAPATTTTTKAPQTSATNVSGNTGRSNKENLTGKSTNTDQRKQQTNVSGDNNNQYTRVDSGRGRGYPRRGGSAGQDRPPYEGGGQQRTQRFNKFEGQQSSNEPSGDTWGNETGNDNQQFSGSRGRGGGRGRGRGNYEGGRGRGNYEGGRGRGNYEGGRGRGNYEGGRGRGNYEGGRGRGRGGRGNFNNRSFEEGSQQQQQQPAQESNTWEQSADANFDNTRSQSANTAGQEFDADASLQERPFEPGNRRGGRGHFRGGRTFHSNRNYGSDRPNQYEHEGGDQEDNRQQRRQHDRQPRSYVSGVKPIEKKDGEGAHNWGSATENPDENPVVDETNETAGQAGSAAKDWAQQVEEAEKQMTLDEYKKQVEAKKRAQQEKVPQFNRRNAGEGEDPKNWQKFEQEYRKKNAGEESGEELEEGSGSEINESGDENEEQLSGKKKVITIPLHFKPIELSRGPANSRGGPRRGTGGSGRYRDRTNRDDQTRSKSPSQQQSSFYQQTGEFHNDEQQQQQQQSRPPRGGSGRGSGRGEYRRSYGNSARGSRGGYNRSNIDPNTPNFDNTEDFPTLPKQ